MGHSDEGTERFLSLLSLSMSRCPDEVFGFQVFLPAAALLAWFSCTTCCYAKLHFRRQYPLHRKLCQLIPMGAAYLLDISPIVQRLATHSWASLTSRPALVLHFLQVVPLFTALILPLLGQLFSILVNLTVILKTNYLTG